MSALSDRFTAAPDKLRALRHGDNPGLLNVWVGLIFDTPKLLDEERLDALRGLARHPYLPKTGLKLAQLPTHALFDVEALETARALGVDLANIDPGAAGSLRRAALVGNAPAQTHVLLDLAGVPDVSLPDLSKSLRRMLDGLCVHSFRYLLEHRAPLMEQAFSVHSPALTLAVQAWVNAFSKDEGLARMNAILHTMSSAGAVWDRAFSEVLNRSTSPARQAWVVPFRQELANWKAAYLNKAWALAEQEEQSKPRSRPRL